MDDDPKLLLPIAMEQIASFRDTEYAKVYSAERRDFSSLNSASWVKPCLVYKCILVYKIAL